MVTSLGAGDAGGQCHPGLKETAGSAGGQRVDGMPVSGASPPLLAVAGLDPASRPSAWRRFAAVARCPALVQRDLAPNPPRQKGPFN